MTAVGPTPGVDASGDFDRFVADARSPLRRGLIGAVGVDRVDDAVAEAMAWAFEHRAELETMQNPIGYLFRVGQSKVRRPKTVVRRLRLLRNEAATIPDVEPGLLAALASLPATQRTAVWLAHGCQWTHPEIASAMDVSSSTVATHIRRGLEHLREELGAER